MESIELTDFPDTRDSILLRIQSLSDREAWDQFAEMYQPVIFRIAKSRGLQDADAFDVVQRVLMAVASSITRWAKQGKTIKFRHWLRRVTRNAVINALSRKPLDRATGSTSIIDLLNEVPEDCEKVDADFELERRREIFLRAAKAVREEVAEETWQVFELTVLQQKSAEEAALETQKEIGAVYTAKSRVTDRIRRAVKKLEELEQ